MRQWMFAAALPLALASATVIAGTPLPDAPHVVVQGEGEVSVAPDAAVVTMVVRHRAATPGEAKRVVDRAVNALLKAAPGFDVAGAGFYGLVEKLVGMLQVAALHRRDAFARKLPARGYRIGNDLLFAKGRTAANNRGEHGQ